MGKAELDHWPNQGGHNERPAGAISAEAPFAGGNAKVPRQRQPDQRMGKDKLLMVGRAVEAPSSLSLLHTEDPDMSRCVCILPWPGYPEIKVACP